MGSAILSGLVRNPPSKGTPQLRYTAHVNTQASSNRLKETFASHSNLVDCYTYGTDQLNEAVSNADIILLGFVPGDLDNVLSHEGFVFQLKGKLIISMLAGISTSHLLEKFQSNCPNSSKEDFSVTRIIPTLSAKIGESVTLIAPMSSPPALPTSTVEDIFSRIGSVHYISEKLMDTATAIGAAMHALAIVAVDSATDASVADGRSSILPFLDIFSHGPTIPCSKEY